MQPLLGTQAGNELIWTTPDPTDKEVRQVYFGMAQFGSYRSDDLKARNILVGLVGATGIRRSAIAEAFGLNRCLVSRYTKELLKHGAEGVVQDGRGRKSKVNAQMEEFVGRAFRKLYRKSRKNFTGKLIAKVKERYGVELSRELIRQIIKPIRAEINSGEGSRLRPGARKKKVRECVPAKLEDSGENGAGLVRTLQRGMYSRYAGGLLLHTFMSKLLEGVFSAPSESGGRSFALMVMQMVQFDVVNLERVKRLHRDEFGLLLGREKSPTVTTMRRKLTEMVEGVDSRQAMVKLARNYIEHLTPESSTFSITLTRNWGKAEVLEGYSNLYHKPMEGTEHCFVHDGAGTPIFLSLRDEYHSFNEVIGYMAKRLKELVGPGKEVWLVFDRGGYDQKVFKELDRMGIKYAVWLKGDKSDYESLGLEYEEQEFEFRGNTPRTPRKVKMGIAVEALPEAKRGMPKRKVILRRPTTRRLAKKKRYMYSAFVLNDEEGSAEVWTEAMLLRWRQECDFKMQRAEFGLDQITSYEKKGYREGAHEDIEEKTRSEVEGKEEANPALKPWRERKRKLKREIGRIDEQLGKQTFKDSKLDLRTVSEVALKRGTRKLLARRKKWVGELEEVLKAMKEIPSKVNKLELLKERDTKRLDFRKKMVMDLLKVAAHNARRMALGVLDKHHRNYRDQVDFLRRLIRCGGEVRMGSNGEVQVTLSGLNTPAENRMASAFLSEINGLKPVFLGTDSAPLSFRLGD